MVSLISVGYLLTSITGLSAEVSSLGFLFFPGPRAPQEAMTSSFVFSTDNKQPWVSWCQFYMLAKNQKLSRASQCYRDSLERNSLEKCMREGVVLFSRIAETVGIQAKNISYFLQKYYEITNTVPPSSLNRASGFIPLKAHESHYVQSHTFKAPIQNPHTFITTHIVDQDKQMRLLTRGSIFFCQTHIAIAPKGKKYHVSSWGG